MRFSRRHLIAYLALAAVIAAVGVRYLVVDGAPSGGEQLVLTPVSSPQASVSEASGATTAGDAGGSASADVVVHVCGAVRSPGIIRLPQGSRVADALEAAGGATGKAELAGVNLASHVADGQQIVVPERALLGAAAGPTPAGSGLGSASGSGVIGGPVNINTASLAQLETLPGVGPSTAQKIIDYRAQSGGFKAIDELKNVPGIGDAKFDAVKDVISI